MQAKTTLVVGAAVVIVLGIAFIGGVLNTLQSIEAPQQENQGSTHTDADVEVEQVIAHDANRTSFVCADGSRIIAALGEGEAVVLLPEKRVVELARDTAASGERYESVSDEVVLFIRGDTATVEERGEQILSDCIEERANGEPARVVRGTVLNIDQGQVMVDGPYLITVATARKEEVIALPSMGMGFCDARMHIEAINHIKEGDRIEARGAIDYEGRVVPCESAEHFLRIITDTNL